MPGGKGERCFNANCDNPTQSRKFCRIEEGRTSGGQDWSPLAGSVLCNACYQRFKSRGTLERTANKRLAASERRCTYEHCERPEQGNFLQIGEGKTSGGQDWSSLVGSVLCQACYVYFKGKGTLERTYTRPRPLAASERRCAYEHCDRPEESSQFNQIGEGKTSGGQDWSSLAGSVLCNACYVYFKGKGTLERTRPLAASARRCTYEHCDRPEESSQFIQVGEGTAAGGRDWSSLAGSVLCKACYDRFKRSGTLERTANRPLAGSARRCTYEHCDSPAQSRQFHQIGEDKTTGGQDWSSLAGNVLCNACYMQFKSRGTLERTALAASARRCTYEHCERPEQSRGFYKIEEGTAAGGQDWSSLAGSVLCQACYNRFLRSGTLHRCDSRPSKKQKISRPQRQQPSALGTSTPPRH